MRRFLGLWLGFTIIFASVSFSTCEFSDEPFMKDRNCSKEEVKLLFSDRAQNQTTAFQRVLKIIPEVRQILQPGEPPLEDTMIHKYLKELSEIEAGIKDYNQMKESPDEDEIAYLRRKVLAGTSLLKRVIKLSPQLRLDVLQRGEPPLEDTLLHKYLTELHALEAAIPKLIDF